MGSQKEALRTGFTFSHILTTLRQCEVGAIYVGEPVARQEWQIFLSLVLSFASRDEPNKLSELQQSLTNGGVVHITVEGVMESDIGDEEEAKEVAKRTYQQSVAVTKEVVNSVRMGRTASVKKVKRAVQNIVDQVLQNEVSLVGLTTLRDYDEYTFTHSVNVCIFSVSVGKRLGLSKIQLYDLGLTALLHDVGKTKIDTELLTAPRKLTNEEFEEIKSHTTTGYKVLRKCRFGEKSIPLSALDHHEKLDGSGYPSGKTRISKAAQIIGVIDCYEALTNNDRPYRSAMGAFETLSQVIGEESKKGKYDVEIYQNFVKSLGSIVSH